MLTVGIVGASGYTGGEAFRILLRHPGVQVVQATSESNAGHFVYTIHPNLRKQSQLKFISINDLKPCDVLFLCLPHGSAMRRIGQLENLATKIIDLSADFRLRNPDDYPLWYDHPHEAPQYLKQFVYGIPELHRQAISQARFITGAGCLATASILGLLPLFKQDVLARREVFIEAKVGSSAAGDTPNLSTHHPERSGSVRSFQPTAHRHTAEITQELSFGQPLTVHFSATAIEAVRGVLATCHVFLKDGVEEKDVWRLYRSAYGEEPFMRIVKERQGIYRYPEPKILAGTNFCDVGFEKEPRGARLVVMAALDNLVKGAAGNGVQAMNLACGLPETASLDFPGLHPI
jgi:N-acetyl-gamma-glutamyl-phosphate/LysW-gamma-L-alpha-aminoadipyl-6-phosphate reductase